LRLQTAVQTTMTQQSWEHKGWRLSKLQLQGLQPCSR
jgi:hypothetical protein